LLLVQMGMRTEEFWLMPISLFLDLWACHKQFLGMEKLKQTGQNHEANKW
jgi:hypothetical protein